MLKLTAILLLTALIPASLYSAENSASVDNGQSQNEEHTIDSGLLPDAVSIFPGFNVHGAGHFAGGDTDTAVDLLIMEGAGLLAFIGAGYAIADTVASRKTIIPAIPVVTAGA